MSSNSPIYLEDLDNLIAEIPPDSILSRTIFEAPHLKAVLFGFAAGQELSEHTASQPAVLHFLRGEAGIMLGEDRHEASPGTWIHLPAQLPHSVHAKTSVLMLLLLIRS